MMRRSRTRLSSIAGALLAIGAVLAVAMHISEMREGAGTSSLAAVGMRGQPVPVSAEVAPIISILDQIDATEQGRARVVVHALVAQADRATVERELSRLADRLYRDTPAVCAMAILGYSSEGQRAALGDEAPWSLVWSPDGLGWAGDARNDYSKHIQTPAQ
jgi:hypothetical protein